MKQDKRKHIKVEGSIAHVQRVVFTYTTDKDLLSEVKRRRSGKCKYWSIGDKCHNPGSICPKDTDQNHGKLNLSPLTKFDTGEEMPPKDY